LSATTPNTGEYLLNFDSSGATTTTALPVTIAALIPGEFVAIVVEWDQPYITGAPNSGGATSQIDLCITGASGSDQISDYAGNAATCSGPNGLGTDSYQVMTVGNPANASGNTAAETLNIVIGLANGTKAPGRIKVSVEDDGAGSTINAFQTNTATIQGHPGAAGAAGVRLHPCAARDLLVRRRRTDSVRYFRHPSRDAGGPPKAGFRRARWSQQHIPGFHLGERRIHRRIAQHHQQLLPE
jgi:hypothetical protein